MKLTCTIVAHESRAEWAFGLESKLKAQGADVNITWDEVNDQWHTARRALLEGTESDWHVVLEDDAIIGDHFYHNALQAIYSVPEPTLISFYTGTLKPNASRVRRAVFQAHRQNAGWLSFMKLNWGVGIAINSKDIVPMLIEVKNFERPYDQRIGKYYTNHKKTVYYTVPSIVNHRDGTSVNKTATTRPRVAHNYSELSTTFNSKVIPM